MKHIFKMNSMRASLRLLPLLLCAALDNIFVNTYLKMKSKRPVYLCSYPKSGRTWLRFILANYINRIYDLGLNIDFRTMFMVIPDDTLFTSRSLLNYGYYTDDKVPFILCSQSKYVSRKYGGSDIIFLLRSPLDVLVSFFFHETKQLGTYNGDLKSFIRDPRIGIPRLIKYLNSWSQNLHLHRNVVVTYEEMHENTEQAVTKVLAFLNFPLNSDFIREAVENSVFDKMRNIELRNGFPDHHYDRYDPDARRVRKGIVGGYVECLDAADRKFIKDLCSTEFNRETKCLLSRYKLNW